MQRGQFGYSRGEGANESIPGQTQRGQFGECIERGWKAAGETIVVQCCICEGKVGGGLGKYVCQPSSEVVFAQREGVQGEVGQRRDRARESVPLHVQVG